MKLARDSRARPALALVTFIPLVWLLAVTGTASIQKIWHPKPAIGFLAKAEQIKTEIIPKLELNVTAARSAADAAGIKRTEAALKTAQAQRANNFLDAVVTGVFLALVTIVVLISIREWLLLLGGRKRDSLRESEPVWLPTDAPAAAAPISAFGVAVLGFTLLKEVSGEAAIERATAAAQACNCAQPLTARARQNVFLTATEDRFRGINRCC